MKNIEKKVINIVKNCLCSPKVKLTDSLLKDLGADSLDLVDIMLRLEKEFDITIVDSDYSRLNTVQDLIDLVNNLKKKEK